MPSIIRHLATAAALSLCLSSAKIALSQNREFEKEDIPATGSKLPADFSDIHEISKYQRRLTTHQKLFITWDSMNGRQGFLKKEEADAYGNTSGTFTLAKQQKGLAGSPGPVNTSLYQNRILIVGRSKSNEIRCLATIHDPREMHSEDFRGGTPNRIDSVDPMVTFDLEFCDDSDITALDFLQLDPRSAEKVFRRLGTLTLAKKDLPLKK
jgi:hypothetical protein